jgi:uncharacterized membrane protein
VTATITNLKSESATFTLDVFGFQSWASLEDISDRLLQLDSGESKDVTITFTVDEDASGEEEFTIGVVSEGISESRDVLVNIEGESTGGVGGFSFGNNTYLWIIGIINVILIILIIIVAVRISSR